MKFLVQSNLMGEQSLRDVKEGLGDLPHEFVGVIPFSREITSNTPIEGTDYIPYGSTLFVNLANELGWKGLHFDLAKFNYSAAVANRDDMLNDHWIVSISDAIEFLEGRPTDEQWFTRPSHDLKQFSGHCLDAGDCAAWFKDAMECDSTGSYKLESDTMVVLARPKKICAEWRYFIVDGKIISGSMYRFNGRLYPYGEESDHKCLEEAQEMANKWLPDPCCVMDIALVDDESTPKVIEFNCINGSGFYGHDIGAIFRELYNYHDGR